MHNDRPAGGDEQARGQTSDWPAERGPTNQPPAEASAPTGDQPTGDDQLTGQASDR